MSTNVRPPAGLARRKGSQPKWIKIYLTTYNAVMIAGWAYFLWTLCKAVVAGNNLANPASVLRDLAWDLLCLQAIELLETIHSLFSLVSSNVVGNLVLWSGRMFAVGFGAMTLAGVNRLKLSSLVSWSFILMGAVWAIADMIRLTYYIEDIWSRGSTATDSLVKRLRYGMFIVLFPVGTLAEAVLLNAARSLKYSGTKWNLPILGYLCAVLPAGFIFIYLHMFRQRSQKLKHHRS